MITIPNSIQQDLITDINNFDVMAVISSANDIFSTYQQNNNTLKITITKT